jgi:hypothetical protein
MEEDRSAFKILTDKSTGNRPLGRLRRRWENNVRRGLKETSVNARDWVDSSHDRKYLKDLVNTASNRRIP